MPESLEVLPQKICENLSDLCPECLNTGSLVCNAHEVLVAAAAAASAPTSGGSCRSVRGSKRPFSLESSDSRSCGNMEHAAKVSKCLAASTGGARDESPASSNAQPLSDIPRIHRCSMVEDVERGLLCPVVPSIGFDSIPPILMPSTATFNTGSLGIFSNPKDWDEEFEFEEHLGILLEEENQESEVVQDDDVTVEVSVSSMNNLVAAAQDDQVIDQWLYPEFVCCASSEVQKFSPSIPSFELDFDNCDFGAHEADHNLRSSLDYMPSGDDGDDTDIQLWDHNNN
ncbi:hypothetical protein CY35_11G043600 [Sphagnum magellanicum]|nr:hypothetical protein CY35_11G043600 [Sphagnum magellanicum]